MDAKGHLTVAAQQLERRRRRQADALRANLRKRKDQAERRGARPSETLAASAPGPDEGN